MEILLVILTVLGGILLLVPYGLTRLALHLTLAMFADKTSPQAAAVVRWAANLCFGLGLLFGGGLAVFIWNTFAGFQGPIFLGISCAIGAAPVLAQWAAIRRPLRVSAAAAPAPQLDAGFSRF